MWGQVRKHWAESVTATVILHLLPPTVDPSSVQLCPVLGPWGDTLGHLDLWLEAGFSQGVADESRTRDAHSRCRRPERPQLSGQFTRNPDERRPPPPHISPNSGFMHLDHISTKGK